MLEIAAIVYPFDSISYLWCISYTFPLHSLGKLIDFGNGRARTTKMHDANHVSVRSTDTIAPRPKTDRGKGRKGYVAVCEEKIVHGGVLFPSYNRWFAVNTVSVCKLLSFCMSVPSLSFPFRMHSYHTTD